MEIVFGIEGGDVGNRGKAEGVEDEERKGKRQPFSRPFLLVAHPSRSSPVVQKGPAKSPEAERVEVDRYSARCSRRRGGEAYRAAGGEARPE